METYELLKEIGDSKSSFAMSLINGRKQPLKIFATQIALDIIPILYDILDKKGKVKNISLIIRSNGGILDAPLPIVNLIREYCTNLYVFVPENAHSAATLIALAGDKIIMSPISSLSPIDPQINLSSSTEKNNISFSVEDVAGYYKLLDKLKITDDGKIQALEFITRKIDPTILGQIERVREYINIIADRILKNEKFDETKKRNIVKKLIEEIPSHNYQISRKEALELGLPIENETDEQHKLLRDLMTLYKENLKENEEDIVIDFKDDTATIDRTYNRAYIETKEDTYAFETKYIFFKNKKIDQSLNRWRKIR